MDLFGRGKILLTGCELLVIDEADRMLDMGFIPDIEEICTKLPKTRQTLLFSATMPPPIKKLADKFLSNPKTIEVSRPASTNLNITQKLVPTSATRQARHAARAADARRGRPTAIIFCNRKTTVRDLNKSLRQSGFKSGEIHGDMEQRQRIAELDLFKAGDDQHPGGVATSPRAGWTSRASATSSTMMRRGIPTITSTASAAPAARARRALAYTLVTPDDAENIENIEKLTGQKLERESIDADRAA